MDSLTSLTYSMGLVFLAGTIENSTKYLCEPNFMKNLHCCKQEVCIFVVAFLSLYYLKKKIGSYYIGSAHSTVWGTAKHFWSLFWIFFYRFI